ncbi:MAG: tetratricopeptide repeat protein [Chryseobacterium sp.]|nr:MAG: tetratricopeptide repeat protein [Chryseobacterium sp.]
MKKQWLLIFIPILTLSQNKEGAKIKVIEGVSLHDEGKYADAITKYNEALTLDKNNLQALSEKAMTLDASKQYDEAVEVSKLAISSHPSDDLKTVYLSYANSLDHQKKADLALKIYDEGLKKYPEYYQLYFNKGITLINLKQTEKALECFQKSARLNPDHATSINALAALTRDTRIPSIMASSRYLILDNKSPRAKANLASIIDLMSKGVSQKDDKSINLTFDPETIDKVASNKKSQNNFSAADMVLSMAAALDFDDKNKNKTDVQKFIDKFESICSTMDETKKGQKGFYWEFLAPYFIEMKLKNQIEPFAYIIFLPKQSADVIKYHEDNSQKIKDFYEWSDNFVWK